MSKNTMAVFWDFCSKSVSGNMNNRYEEPKNKGTIILTARIDRIKAVPSARGSDA